MIAHVEDRSVPFCPDDTAHAESAEPAPEPSKVDQ